MTKLHMGGFSIQLHGGGQKTVGPLVARIARLKAARRSLATSSLLCPSRYTRVSSPILAEKSYLAKEPLLYLDS